MTPKITDMQWTSAMQWLICFALICVATCGAVFTGKLPWWRTANFYQVYPRSFKDSDGDGIGDLQGVVQKASYFKEIGVDAIWLSPFYPSPLADFGYDIANFTAVDPTFGTMDDFRAVAKAMEDNGIKLVVDFVPNHSSDEHPWFQKSVLRIDPYTDFYIWDDGFVDNTTGVRRPPNNWLRVFNGPAWTWHDVRKQWYFHDFAVKQPDLNYRNPKVIEKMDEVIRFWLDIGVDGLRLDAAKYMYETKNIYQNETQIPGTTGTEWADYYHNLTQNQPETYELMNHWAEIFYNYTVKDGKSRALFVEVYTDLEHTMMYYGKGNTSLMQPFNFQLLVHGNRTTRTPKIKEIIDSWIQSMPDGDVPNWVIGNHDNRRIADRYGVEMVYTMNMLTMVLPGNKVVYYGEEIGMQDTFIRWDQTVDTEGLILGPYNYTSHSRDPERTPMQWDSSVSAGFSTNKTTWLPVNPNYWWLNVKAQQSAPNSHLKIFTAMAQLKKDPVLRRGDLTVLAPNNDTLIVLRTLNNTVYALVSNFGSYLLDLSPQALLGQWLGVRTNVSLPNMEVALASSNYDGHKVGDFLKGSTLNISLRPKSSVLLRIVSSSAGRLFTCLPLLLAAVLKTFWR